MAAARKPAPSPLVDTNVLGHHSLPSPRRVQKLLPASKTSLDAVARGRRAIRDILIGKDDRLFLVVGPCSIHDPLAAYEYAERLQELAEKVQNRFVLVMRVYF